MQPIITYHQEALGGRLTIQYPEGDVAGYVSYVFLSPSRILIDHTVVEDAFRGQGLAAILMQALLAYARQQQWTLVPACSYAQVYIQRHPAYSDLLATEQD